jgi:multiubiquitin
MSSPLLHRSSDESADSADEKGEDQPSNVRITVIVQNRYTFDTERVTGRQVREAANVPAGFALFRRAQGGNERISDDEEVKLHNGDHFFARPSSSPS